MNTGTSRFANDPLHAALDDVPDTGIEGTRLLLVDDELPVLRALQRSLRQAFGAGLAVRACQDPGQALQHLAQTRFDAVLSDIHMPGLDGMRLLHHCAELQPECVRMILTGQSDFALAQRAMNELGVVRYLSKPWDDEALARGVASALREGLARRRERDQALAWAAQHSLASPQSVEARRLEALEPGLTRVHWEPDGSIRMPPLERLG
jgi:two-component system, probable response regulator PhcQ